MIQDIVGNSVVGSPHRIHKRVGGRVQPVVDLRLSLSREYGGAHGAGDRQGQGRLLYIDFHNVIPSFHRLRSGFVVSYQLRLIDQKAMILVSQVRLYRQVVEDQ